MQSAFDVEFEQSREFEAVGDAAGLFGEILKDDARVVGASKESAIDAVGTAPHNGSGNPHEGNTKHRAEDHSELRVLHEISGEKPREKKNGQGLRKAAEGNSRAARERSERCGEGAREFRGRDV